ncbi:suppressor of fused protein SUFU [Solirubrobacter pauli]|uniref:Suppressor of fused protein SUFU n=2 Tax=Solirubrobacter pauli TaxID=166793 RepID=A0A660LB40_9ACTN|nr:suppressor of fused protein SUFU [Solirubrobacter pauli]
MDPMGLFDRKRRKEQEDKEPLDTAPVVAEIIKGIDAHLDLIDAVEHHIKRHFGEPAGVLRSNHPDDIAMFVMPPTEDRPRFTIITSGMSRMPMQGAPSNYTRAELVIALPPDWKLGQDDLGDERNWWPLRLLQNLSHMPQANGGWLGFGHTIPHGSPPQHYADDTTFCGALLFPPVWTPSGFNTLQAGDETVQFIGVYTLHGDELQFAQEEDGQAMFARFAEHQVSELVDLQRPSVV